MSRVIVVLSALVIRALFNSGMRTPPSGPFPRPRKRVNMRPVYLCAMATAHRRPRQFALSVDPDGAYAFNGTTNGPVPTDRSEACGVPVSGR